VRMEAWQGRFIMDSRNFGHHVELDEGGLLMEAIWPFNRAYRLDLLQSHWDFLRVGLPRQPAKTHPAKVPVELFLEEAFSEKSGL
jgi:hypothetical protein